MSYVTHSLLGAIALAGVAAAQSTPRLSVATMPAPINAGTFHVASGQFVPANNQQQFRGGANDVIFASNYYTGFFYDIDDGTVVTDEGRVPSTTSVGLVGTADSYRITGIQIAYATDSNTPVSMRLRMWHQYDTCQAPTGAPIADITLTNMPGTIQSGAFTPYTFDIDMSMREFCLLADGDGTYSNGFDDRFGFSLQVLDGGDGTETGPIVGLRPGPFAPVGDGTVFQNPGAAAGSGLGAVDQWYDEAPAGPSTPLAFTGALPGTWMDISATGTLLAHGDDTEIDIPTTVGNSLLAAGVARVGSNGGIRFNGTGVDLGWTNGAIPNAVASSSTGCFGGDQTLLPFWDDLNPGLGGDVRWQEIGDTLIVQWTDVAFVDHGDSATFQVQVHGSGPALAQFLYQDIEQAGVGGGVSATIGYQAGGIENDVQFSLDTLGAVSNGTVLSLVGGPNPGVANCLNWGGYNPLTNNPAFGSFWLVLESDLSVNCTGCDNGIDDAFEPNDDCGSAVAVAAPAVITNLVTEGIDEDYYLVTVAPGTALNASIAFTHTEADLDMFLYLASDCMNSIDFSNSSSDTESVDYFNCGSMPVDVVVSVFVYNNAANCGDYSLTLTTDSACNVDDLLEDNDDCSQAYPLSLGFTPNLRITACDEDYFFLDADPGETLNIGIFFSDAVADLDLFLYSAGGNCGTPAGLLAASTSSSNDEFLTWTNTTGQVQSYVLHVDWFDAGTSNCQVYQMAYTRDPSTEIGFQFCTAEINSTNRGAHILATGSDVVADNDVTLSCIYLPDNSNGYFLNSRTQIFLPFPGGSLGNLCIAGGAVGRFNANVLNTGPMGGQVSLLIDLTSIPRPSGTQSVMVGDTWYFQYWYRDVVGMAAVSNFSDAVGVTFQ
ncbi:MAG: hypothetical protein R3F49_19530 [Planctomycetota bacterium]